LLSCNLQYCGLRLIVIVCLIKLSRSFSKFFKASFEEEQQFDHWQYPKFHGGCLFLGNIYRAEGVVVLCRWALSNSEIAFFCQLHTINTGLNKRLLFFTMDQSSKLESNDYRGP
jgi:hypothetical protein